MSRAVLVGVLALLSGAISCGGGKGGGPGGADGGTGSVDAGANIFPDAATGDCSLNLRFVPSPSLGDEVDEIEYEELVLELDSIRLIGDTQSVFGDAVLSFDDEMIPPSLCVVVQPGMYQTLRFEIDTYKFSGRDRDRDFEFDIEDEPPGDLSVELDINATLGIGVPLDVDVAIDLQAVFLSVDWDSFASDEIEIDSGYSEIEALRAAFVAAFGLLPPS